MDSSKVTQLEAPGLHITMPDGQMAFTNVIGRNYAILQETKYNLAIKREMLRDIFNNQFPEILELESQIRELQSKLKLEKYKAKQNKEVHQTQNKIESLKQDAKDQKEVLSDELRSYSATKGDYIVIDGEDYKITAKATLRRLPNKGKGR